MGSLSAQGFADAVNDGDIQLTTALSWHLSSNHYPALPSFFIPTCIAAIEAGNDEDWDRELQLPRGCRVHKEPVELDATHCAANDGCEVTNIVEWKDGRDVVRVGDLIESFHLDSFINCYDDEEEDEER